MKAKAVSSCIPKIIVKQDGLFRLSQVKTVRTVWPYMDNDERGQWIKKVPVDESNRTSLFGDIQESTDRVSI